MDILTYHILILILHSSYARDEFHSEYYCGERDEKQKGEKRVS